MRNVDKKWELSRGKGVPIWRFTALFLVLFAFGAQNLVLACTSQAKLVLSDITCADNNTVRVHFVVNQLPSHVSDYGIVSYKINNQSRTANFVSVSGSVAQYEDFFPTVSTGIYNVSSGNITIDGTKLGLQNPQTATVLCAVPEQKVCSLVLTKAVDKSSAGVGDILTYTISAKNTGTADCTGGGVKIADTVDANLSFLTESHSSGIDAGYNGIPIYTSSTRNLIWDANTITPGQTKSVTWTGKIVAPNICGSFNIVDKASATSAEYSNFTVWVDSNTVTTGVSYSCPPAMSVSCSGAPDPAFVGQSVAWTAQSTGGNGSYAYVWSGDDGLLGSATTTTGIYNSTGTKNATVNVTSGLQNAMASCHISIINNPPPPGAGLDGSCSGSPSSANVGDTVTWTAVSTGGTGEYSYFWSGDDGLSGGATSTSLLYSISGTKNAQVIITSGNSSVTRNCSVNVNAAPPPPGGGFSASCSVSQGVANIGDPIIFTATASGGTGTYSFSWTGSEGLDGDTATVTKSFISAGTKSASVSVTSGNNMAISPLCTVNILPPAGCTSNCGGGFDTPKVVLLKTAPMGQLLSYVYLSQIPYTGFGDNFKLIVFILVVILWSLALVLVFKSKFLRSIFGKTKDMSAAVVSTGQDENAVYEVKGEDPIPEYADNILTINKEDIMDNRNYSYARNPQTDPEVPFAGSEKTSAMENHNHNNNNGNKPGIIDLIAAEAQKNKSIISEDGMRLIIDTAANDAGQSLGLLSGVIRAGETMYPREDGWLLMNKEKVGAVISLIGSADPLRYARPMAKSVVEEKKISAPNAMNGENHRNQASVENRPASQIFHADVSMFVNWLAMGDKEKVVSYLRSMREREGQSDEFIKKVIFDLDGAFRARFEDSGEPTNERIANAVSGLSNESLEKLINILLSLAGEGFYKSPNTGMKVALMRIAELKKENR